nr:hypothetical protein [bacterium]
TTQWMKGTFRPFHYVQIHHRHLLTGLILLAVVIPAFSRRPSWIVSWPVGLVGASVILSEIMLMFQLQMSTGALYRDAGILIGLCTAGLCIGSLCAGWTPPGRSGLIPIQVLIALLFSLSFIILPEPDGHAVLRIYLPGFLFGCLGGIHFGVAGRTFPQWTPVFYGADLTGAAVASFLVILFILPVMGFRAVAGIAAALNFLYSGVLLFRLKPSE